MKKALTWVLVVIAVLIVIGLFAPNSEQTSKQAKQEKTEQVPAVSEAPAGPTPATGVANVLKTANVFPQSNLVTSLALSETDKAEGAIAAANIASSRPEGVTIKVYNTPTERNQARLRMIKECPGCNNLTECGAILMYSPDPTTGRNLGQMSQQARDSLREVAETQRERHRRYYEVLREHYGCE